MWMQQLFIIDLEVVVLAVLSLMVVTTDVLADAGAGARFMNHGVAASVGQAGWRGVVATKDVDGSPLIVVHLWTGDRQTKRSLLLIDAETGEAEQIPMPLAYGSAGFCTWLSEDRYFYTTIAEHLIGYDLHKRAWFLTEKVPEGFAYGFAEDDAGMIYASLYPHAEVVRFNPRTRELTNFGPMAKEDWPQYPMLAADSAGWVYVCIGLHRFNLVALNPQLGERRALLSEQAREAVGPVRRAAIWRGDNGRVYVQPTTHDGAGQWYELYEGALRVIDEPAAVQAYFDRHRSRPWQAFPDGGRIEKIDVGSRYAIIVDAKGQESRITFDYESEGVQIFSLEAGPDGRLYGSTGRPMRFFRFDPQAGTMDDWGFEGYGGHINDMVTVDGRIYGAVYSRGSLMVYDPAQPWEDAAMGESSNPKELYERDETVDLFGRPHVLLAHSDGRHLLMGGNAQRTMTGGGMLVYDLEDGTHRILDREALLPDQGVMAMAELVGGDLLVGSTARPPTGGVRQAEAGSLYVLSWPELQRRAVTGIEVGLEVRDLLAEPGGRRVFGLSHERELFVFDAESRRVVSQVSLAGYGELAGSQAPRTLAFGPDGRLYVLLKQAIVSVDPQTMAHKLEATPPVPVDAGAAVLEGRLYFSSGTELWSYTLPTGD